MDRKALYYMLFVTVAIGSAAFPQMREKAAQPSSQTIQKKVVSSKNAAFLKTIERAKSLDEVLDAFKQSAFTPAEQEQLKRECESSIVLQEKLRKLRSAAVAASEPRVKQQEASVTREIQTLDRSLGQKRMVGPNKEVLSMKRNESMVTDPAIRCKADAPAVESVTPVTPGAEFAVRGRGFGETAGTVEVFTEGKVFSAHVVGWNSCVIYAMLGGEISGVRANPQALVSIGTADGKKTRATAVFTPILEVKSRHEWASIDGAFWGTSKDYTYWNSSLKNDWYVIRTSLVHERDGHAELTETPPVEVPNGGTRTRVHAGGAAGAWGRFDVWQIIAGPKGLSHK